MNIFSRIQMGFHSELGVIFFILIGIFCLLAITYVILLYQKKKHDKFAYLYQRYYELAESQSSQYLFSKTHQADFLGRKSVVKSQKGEYLSCLIPPPPMANDIIRERFQMFHRNIQNASLKLFAPYEFVSTDKEWIMIQNNILKSNGRPFLSLEYFFRNNRLTESEREKILLDIATALAKLHEIHNDLGENLYHGFLLPRSIYLELDPNFQPRRVVIADLGVYYSLGPELVFERLENLMEGILTIEKNCSQRLIEQFNYLAPEQRALDWLNRVGSASDFYSFGALAVSMFTKTMFHPEKEIDWEKIPKTWHPFLKSCLENLSENRPKDFRELCDWLDEPELSLISEDVESEHVVNVENITIPDIKELLEEIRKKPKKEINLDESQLFNDQLSHSLEAGDKAFKTSKWKIAKNHYQSALAIQPSDVDIHTNLAIVSYELGEYKDAEEHYNFAKKKNPHSAKKFREHIAFRI